MKQFAYVMALLSLLCLPVAASADDDVARMVATLQIENLRRDYAFATDLIGTNVPENVEKGRAIYRRIFTADVKISASNGDTPPFRAVGPDEWVDVAAGALKVFDATQHLIGTQRVQIESMPGSEQGGHATMTSYLQAWHSDPDRVLDIFIGTYHDKLRYTEKGGWQIYEMHLEKVSGEVTPKP